MASLDRHLLDDDAQPSPRFAARVMSAVRREASTPPPIPFPWLRLTAGLVSTLVWLMLGWRAIRGGDAEAVRALAGSPAFLVAFGLGLTLASARLVRFCLRA